MFTEMQMSVLIFKSIIIVFILDQSYPNDKC